VTLLRSRCLRALPSTARVEGADATGAVLSVVDNMLARLRMLVGDIEDETD
jgi:hypothetical protein